MTFRGSLAEVSLADILQLVAVSSRTGILSLRRGEDRGEIHIDKGQISHAATGLLSGDAAFYELARWNSGEFEFAQDVPLGPRTVDKSNPALLEEAIRQAGEWRILATKIHSTRMVPVFSPQAASGVSLAAHEWAIVSRVDERRNLEEIAAALGQSTFDVCKIVYTLLSTGVLALREDLRQLPLERLRRLTAEELGRLAERVHRTALELAPGREMQLNLDCAVRLFRPAHESGRALDALVPGAGELIGGRPREDRLEVLEARMGEQGLNQDDYWWYLDLPRFRTVPHSGFGLGLERMVQFVTGMANIRDVIPFPRTPGNAEF